MEARHINKIVFFYSCDLLFLSLMWEGIRAYFSRKRKMRLNTKGMDARRGVQRMVVPFASFATPQTPFCVQTLRAGHALRAWRCCSLLIWNAKPCNSRLALRAMHGWRTFVSY